jgi:hypothetical protein
LPEHHSTTEVKRLGIDPLRPDEARDSSWWVGSKLIRYVGVAGQIDDLDDENVSHSNR